MNWTRLSCHDFLDNQVRLSAFGGFALAYNLGNFLQTFGFTKEDKGLVAYGGTAEASMAPYDWAILSDMSNSGRVDLVDFVQLAAIFAGQDDQLPADFDHDGDVDLSELALLTEDWLKVTSWHEP